MHRGPPKSLGAKKLQSIEPGTLRHDPTPRPSRVDTEKQEPSEHGGLRARDWMTGATIAWICGEMELYGSQSLHPAIGLLARFTPSALVVRGLDFSFGRRLAPRRNAVT